MMRAMTGLLVGLLLAGGCVNVSAPKEINVQTGGYMNDQPGDSVESVPGPAKEKDVSKSEAHAIARQMAVDKGAQGLENYSVEDKRVDDGWWITYEFKGMPTGNWQNHFAVYVAADRRAWFYGQPSSYKPGITTMPEKPKKDESRAASDEFAASQGLNIGQYKRNDKPNRDNWWMFYNAPGAQFCVRVGKYYQVELYR